LYLHNKQQTHHDQTHNRSRYFRPPSFYNTSPIRRSKVQPMQKLQWRRLLERDKRGTELLQSLQWNWSSSS